MIHTGERYINPLTEFGFKRIFGTPFNSDLLVSFLNAVLDGERVVEDVEYSNSEKFGSNEDARKAIFDVYCKTADGSRFIVEMQNVYQDFYKDRSIFYSTFPISEQAEKGDWNYELKDVDETVPFGADFGVRVSGDSMMPRIHDGDIIYIRKQDTLENGDIGIFSLDGNAYVKKLKSSSDGLFLISLNKKYSPIPVGEYSDFKIFGKALI